MEAGWMKLLYYSSYDPSSSMNNIIIVYWIAGIIGGIIWGVVWGCITSSIMKNKGYTGGSWFWLGCFLGFIGLIIAFSKPEIPRYDFRRYNENSNLPNYGRGANNRIPSYAASSSDDNIEKIKKYKELLDIGAITEEEYNIKKKELLGFSRPTITSGQTGYPDNIIDVTFDTDDELPPL